MRRIQVLFLGLSFIFFNISVSLFSQIHFVPDTFSSLQGAIDNSDDGDTIIIRPGVYSENLTINNKNLVIASNFILSQDSSVIKKTVIDGNSVTVFTIKNPASKKVEIFGLTITNGNDGIFNKGTLSVSSCVVYGCKDGIDLESGSYGQCINSLFYDNTDDAIDFDGICSFSVLSNKLINNSDDGIEIRLHDFIGDLNIDINIMNNIISGNGEDGIQIIDYPDSTSRIIRIIGNVISNNSMAGIGSTQDGNTIEDYNGSNARERVYVVNNTISGNYVGITGSYDMVVVNNIICNSITCGVKHLNQNSILSNSVLWNNLINLENCSFVENIKYEDPLLDFDFKLFPDSPCIDEALKEFVFLNDTVFEYSDNEFSGSAPDIGSEEFAGRIRKGPYLIYPGNPSQMKILWQLKESYRCRIDWGRDEKYSDGSIVSTEINQGADEHQHIIILNNLVPGSLYHYRIIENSLYHYGSFRTAPLSTVGSVNFLALGDTRSYPSNFSRVTKEMNKFIVSDSLYQTIVLHSGDWITNGSEKSWDKDFFSQDYFSTNFILSHIPIQGIAGNHDFLTNFNSSVYKKYWPYNYSNDNCTYSFDYGPVHFCLIDQYDDYTPSSLNYNWIVEDLQSTKKQWKVIVLHEPGYSDGAHDNSLDFQEIIQPLCVEYNVQLVIAGHNHYYAHCIIDKVHHLTLGGGGGPLYIPENNGEGLIYSESAFHFAAFNVTGDLMSVKSIKPGGSILEEFTIEGDGLGISNDTHLPDFKLIPNPASDYCKIITGTYISDGTIELFNGMGYKLLSIKTVGVKNIYEMDLALFKPGVYFIKLSDGGHFQVKKLIIN